ncbi:MAG: hypothetical protein WD872_01755 [Pirellulaceae bacterium]
MSAVQAKDCTVNIAGKLDVRGQIFAIGQIFGNRLVMLDSCSVPSGAEAKLVVTVRGVDKVYHIILPHGINSDSDVVAFF